MKVKKKAIFQYVLHKLVKQQSYEMMCRGYRLAQPSIHVLSSQQHPTVPDPNLTETLRLILDPILVLEERHSRIE